MKMKANWGEGEKAPKTRNKQTNKQKMPKATTTCGNLAKKRVMKKYVYYTLFFVYSFLRKVRTNVGYKLPASSIYYVFLFSTLNLWNGSVAQGQFEIDASRRVCKWKVRKERLQISWQFSNLLLDRTLEVMRLLYTKVIWRDILKIEIQSVNRVLISMLKTKCWRFHNINLRRFMTGFHWNMRVHVSALFRGPRELLWRALISLVWESNAI